MANWCKTQYYIDGDSQQIDELYSLMKSLERYEANDINLTTLDEFNCSSLINACYNNESCLWCRAFWSNLKKLYTPYNEPYLYFEVRSAWDMDARIDESILIRFDKLNLYFYSYEPSCDFLAKNDESGKYFDAEFKLAINTDYVTFEKDYKNEKELAYDVNELLKESNVSTFQEALDALADYGAKAKNHFAYKLLKVELTD